MKRTYSTGSFSLCGYCLERPESAIHISQICHCMLTCGFCIVLQKILNSCARTRYQVAHNEAFSLLRKNRPETELADEPRPPAAGRGLLPIELSLAVETALGRLTADQREAVLLKVYQGFKFDEIAEILDCPVSTVKSRLYTALDQLKTTLAPQALRGEI